MKCIDIIYIGKLLFKSYLQGPVLPHNFGAKMETVLETLLCVILIMTVKTEVMSLDVVSNSKFKS